MFLFSSLLSYLGNFASFVLSQRCALHIGDLIEALPFSSAMHFNRRAQHFKRNHSGLTIVCKLSEVFGTRLIASSSPSADSFFLILHAALVVRFSVLLLSCHVQAALPSFIHICLLQDYALLIDCFPLFSFLSPSLVAHLCRPLVADAFVLFGANFSSHPSTTVVRRRSSRFFLVGSTRSINELHFLCHSLCSVYF